MTYRATSSSSGRYTVITEKLHRDRWSVRVFHHPLKPGGDVIPAHLIGEGVTRRRKDGELSLMVDESELAKGTTIEALAAALASVLEVFDVLQSRAT
jgi:hypothetical protein